jgi:hypothetical protein
MRNLGLVWLGGQHVQIGDDEQAIVFVLQAHPILQGAYVMPQVKLACWPVTCQNPFSFHLTPPI